MFCPKCGTKAIEGAEFCQKCGAKLITDTASKQKIPASAQPKQQTSNVVSSEPKNRPKKLPIIPGIIILVIVAVVFVVLNWEGKTDYEATVREYLPYASTQGLPYTCGEVFDKYIESAKWEVRKSNDVAYVDISGKIKGTDKEVVVTVQVTEEDNRAIMKPSVKVDGEEAAKNTFFAFFEAFHEKDDDLSRFDDLLNEVELALNGESNLMESFTDTATGISFQYPSWWVSLDTPSEFNIVNMISSRNTNNHKTVFKVNIASDAFGVFTQDEATIQDTVNEIHDFLDFGETMLGDIPAKVLKYQTKGFVSDTIGNNIVVTFWYMAGADIYCATCEYAAATEQIYGPIFEAIMSTYTVSATHPSAMPVSSMEEARSMIEDWMKDHPLYGELSGVAERSDNGTDSSGNAAYVFDLWLDPREHAGLVYVRKSDGYMSLKELDSNTEMSLDDWYEVWSSPFH